MRLSEVAEYISTKYPDCCMVINHDIRVGCREEWYEEYLINHLMYFFSFELMNMCGCGCPDCTNELIRKILTIRFEWQEDKLEYEEVIKRYMSDLSLDQDNDNHYGVLQFILYMLDACGIVEHGSSIGGCWLTELGKMYLTVLNAWNDREDSEQ